MIVTFRVATSQARSRSAFAPTLRHIASVRRLQKIDGLRPDHRTDPQKKKKKKKKKKNSGITGLEVLGLARRGVPQHQLLHLRIAQSRALGQTKVGGLQTILEDTKEGFIIEPNDVAGLVARLKQLLDDSQLRRRMGQAGRRKAEEIYDWDIIYEKYYRPLFAVDAQNELVRGVESVRYAYIGPRFVQIDITNKCNNNCLYCWARSPLLKEKKASKQWESCELPLDLVKRLIDELHLLGTENIHIAGGGEPFIHPGIMGIIEYIKQKGMRCKITTNFTLVTEDIARRIIELGVDCITVSLWAGTAGTYIKLHPNKTKEAFFQIVEILKLVSSIKKKQNKLHPLIHLGNVISNINYDEIEQMIDLAKETRADSYFFQVMDPVAGYTDMLLLSDKESQELKHRLTLLKPKIKELALKHEIEVLGLDEFIRRISSKKSSLGYYEEEEILKMPCYAGWVFSRITADGNVNFCLKTDEYPVGNLYKQGFKEIWGSEQYADFRKRMFQRLSLPGQPLRCMTTCDNTPENLYAYNIMEQHR